VGVSARVVWPLYLLAVVEAAALVVLFTAAQYAAFMLAGVDINPWYATERALLLSGVVITMLFAVGLYSFHVADNVADLAARVCVAVVLAFVVHAVVTYVFPTVRITMSALVPGLAGACVLLFALHMAFLRVADMAHLKSRVLVLGTGERAAKVGSLASLGRRSRFMVVGYIELEPIACAVQGARVMPMPNDLSAYAASHAIDEIVVALEDRRGQLPLDDLVAARLEGVRVTDYQLFAEQAQGAVDLEALSPSWFFDRAGFRTARVHVLIKRAIDLVASVGLLTVTLPVLLATALAIKLESPGPVFYRQERVGQGGRPFLLFKFRSMRQDAEADGTPQWAQQADPRVTRVGALIRKARIDEIPQAINVLRGDMSFVGPRPERPFFVDELGAQIPFYRERHAVKPGITGWAQLNYPYGASVEDARQKLQYDLFYIKYYTVMLDIAIGLQTVRVVLWNAGAR
jgi:sugar transferase (PEP-CTERM system associated)